MYTFSELEKLPFSVHRIYNNVHEAVLSIEYLTKLSASDSSLSQNDLLSTTSIKISNICQISIDICFFRFLLNNMTPINFL